MIPSMLSKLFQSKAEPCPDCGSYDRRFHCNRFVNTGSDSGNDSGDFMVLSFTPDRRVALLAVDLWRKECIGQDQKALWESCWRDAVKQVSAAKEAS